MPQMKRTEVAFEVRTHADGVPYVALVLSRHGQPLPTGGREFSLELGEGMPADVAQTVADVLNKTVSHLAMTAGLEGKGET